MLEAVGPGMITPALGPIQLVNGLKNRKSGKQSMRLKITSIFRATAEAKAAFSALTALKLLGVPGLYRVL